MAKQNINIGVSPNDGTGDVVREAFRKSKENFDELYGRATGDMNKSTYDADNSGAVDAADKVTGVDAAGNVTYYGKDAAGNIGFHSFALDKVEAYTDFASFPVTGFDDVIYIDKSQTALYLWSEVGMAYIPTLPKEHEINGTRVTANVATTYAFDWNLASVFDLTMTAATTFSSTNLPTGANSKVINIKLSGNFAPTFPTTWVLLPNADPYDGLKQNLITVNCLNGTAASEVIYYDNRTTT